jgi:hypothetical protein
VPAILSKYEHYINVYCWISDTYYVSFREQTTSVTNKTERMLKYYQWVPMILLSLAFFFVLPRFMYRTLTKQSGLDIMNLADASINFMAVEKFDKRRRTLLYLVNSIHFYSICNKAKRAKDGFTSALSGVIGSPISGQSSSNPHIYNIICCQGKLNGAYLVIVYMMTKIFYIVNSFTQLFILNVFLGFSFSNNGFHVLRDMTRGLINNANSLSELNRAIQANSMTNPPINPSNPLPGGSQPIRGPTVVFDKPEDEPPMPVFSTLSDTIYSEVIGSKSMLHRYFPRESACDFRIRANIDSLVHNYTVQCVLPINLYNEQLFTLLWAWLWIVSIANCYDFVVWIFRLLPSSRFNYIRERIRLRHSESSSKRALNSFVFDYLAFDGVFVSRILSLNSSDCVTHEIMQTLWQNYTESARLGGNKRDLIGVGGGGGGAGANRNFRNRNQGRQDPNAVDIDMENI